MGTFWKCVLVKYVLSEFVLTKDLVYCDWIKDCLWFEHGMKHIDDQIGQLKEHSIF